MLQQGLIVFLFFCQWLLCTRSTLLHPQKYCLEEARVKLQGSAASHLLRCLSLHFLNTSLWTTPNRFQCSRDQQDEVVEHNSLSYLVHFSFNANQAPKEETNRRGRKTSIPNTRCTQLCMFLNNKLMFMYFNCEFQFKGSCGFMGVF